MRFFRINILAATLAVAVLTIAAPAHTQTPYISLADFKAAVPVSTLYDFENIAPSSGTAINPDILTVSAPGRVTFAITGGSNTSVIAADSAALRGFYSLDGTDCVVAGFNGDGVATTRINLDAMYTAFAIEIGQTFNGSNSYTIGLFNDNTQVGTNFATSSTSKFFFGATSPAAFNNVRIIPGSPNSLDNVFDNVRTAGAVVPEAGSLALLLPALGVLGAVVSRRRK